MSIHLNPMTNSCNVCPRKCTRAPYCHRVEGRAAVSKIMLHEWEEPCISGSRGSGVVFFSGCNLRCSYCQNADISRSRQGKDYDADALTVEFARLESAGAHNINLVTATPHLPIVRQALEVFKKQSKLPVVYNTSAYENADAIKSLDGLVDVYLPDLKYYSEELSRKYSSAADYNRAAMAAIDEMVRQQPTCVFDDGIIKCGVIIRHLALPTHGTDSEKVLRQIAERWGDRVKVSLMRQFTPMGKDDLSRPITSYEYNKLLALARELSLDGYAQSKESVGKQFTPNFNV